MKTVIVSAANDRYWSMLSDLLDSIERCRPNQEIDLCMFDVGLTAEQRTALARRVSAVAEPGWDYDFRQRATTPGHTRAQLARPFLRRYFPGYERYIWLDADTWLQDWRAIEMLLHASATGVMAIVPEIHHAYVHNYQVGRERIYVWEHYEACFGKKLAEFLGQLPIINTGVWAMRADAPYWDIWAEGLQKAVEKFAGPLTEQCALNAAIYTGRIKYYPLPAWCNWFCVQAIPLFDPATRLFYEPLIPNDQISILHLIEMRQKEVKVRCTDGTERMMPLTYAGAQGAV